LFGAGAALGMTALAACRSAADEAAGTRGTTAAPADVAPPTTGPASPATVATAATAAATSPSGLQFVGARILRVTVPVDAAAAATLLPPTLRMATPALADFFVAHYPATSFGSVYNEAALQLHVEADDGPALHCPWILVDDDTALILGREMTGFPKKMGEIVIDDRDDRFTGRASRKGTEVLRIEARPPTFTDQPGGVWNQRMLHVNGSVPNGMRMQRLGPLTEEVKARSVGRAELTLGSSPRDDLKRLAPEPVEGDAVIATVDFGQMQDGSASFGEPLPVGWALQRQVATAL
jgi:acetoacetate decarboxylase